MKNRTDYNKIVNYDKENNEVTVLDYTFQHDDNFKGATGTKFEIVSKSQYMAYMSKKYVMEQLIDCDLGKNKVELNVMYSDMKDNDEIEQFVFDLSYFSLHEYIRTELNLSKKDCFILSCSGGGRCFDSNYRGNFNTELSAIIRKAETKTSDLLAIKNFADNFDRVIKEIDLK